MDFAPVATPVKHRFRPGKACSRRRAARSGLVRGSAFSSLRPYNPERRAAGIAPLSWLIRPNSSPSYSLPARARACAPRCPRFCNGWPEEPCSNMCSAPLPGCRSARRSLWWDTVQTGCRRRPTPRSGGCGRRNGSAPVMRFPRRCRCSMTMPSPSSSMAMCRSSPRRRCGNAPPRRVTAAWRSSPPRSTSRRNSAASGVPGEARSRALSNSATPRPTNGRSAKSTRASLPCKPASSGNCWPGSSRAMPRANTI